MPAIMTQLPLSSDSAYRYSIALEGQTRLLYFYWNERVGSWYLDIRNVDEAPVTLGLRLVPNFAMLEEYALQALNWTGVLYLLPDNDEQIPQLKNEPMVMPQFFKLYHYYIKE